MHVKCNNNECKTQITGGYAIIPKGLGTFDIDNEKIIGERCPVCSEMANFTTCGFYKCYYKFKGVEQDNSEKTGEGHSLDSTYLRFRSNSQTTWRGLRITAFLDPDELISLKYPEEDIDDNENRLIKKQKLN